MSILDEVKEIKKIIAKCDAGCLEEAKALLCSSPAPCRETLNDLAIIYSSLATLRLLKEESLLLPCSELLGQACWETNNKDILEFLLAEGFSLDGGCYKYAAESGTLDNLLWLENKNCPLPQVLDLTVVKEMGYGEIIEYCKNLMQGDLSRIEGL
nr:hypothetical protein Clen_5 [Cedratvirus lena]WIL04518.1 hypothetical protein Cduv_38 [Cedratvirus duvanny]